MPIANGICEDTGVFEHEDRFVDCGVFGDGVIPDHSDGVRWAPLTIKAHCIDFELVRADLTIGGVEGEGGWGVTM